MLNPENQGEARKGKAPAGTPLTDPVMTSLTGWQSASRYDWHSADLHTGPFTSKTHTGAFGKKGDGDEQ